jgi:thiamine-monophosphate kinase
MGGKTMRSKQQPEVSPSHDLLRQPNHPLKSKLTEHCLFCEPSVYDQEQQILLRSNNFYLFAGLGAIVEGYILLAPYRCDDPRLPLSSFSDATPDLIDEVIFLRGLISEFYRGCYGHPGMHFEHGRTGVCLYGRDDTKHCYHAHLCCFPVSHPLWEDMGGLKTERLEGLHEIKGKINNSPYLFVQASEIDEKQPVDAVQRENWNSRIVILDNEKQIKPQYLRKLLASRIGQEELWNWATYPEWPAVHRLIESFSQWIKSTKKYEITMESDGIPRIDFLRSIVLSNTIGNDYVAERFYKKWGGQEQYHAIGRFLTYLPRRDKQRPRILDAGCGPGTYLNALYSLGMECIGIDISNEMLKIGREVCKDVNQGRKADHSVPMPILLNMNAFEPDFDERSFDGIWYSAVFVHVPKVQAPSTLASLYRILKDDGIVYLSVQIGGGSVVRYEGRVFFYYTDEEMHQLLRQTGFVVLDEWGDRTHTGSCSDTREKIWKHYLLTKRAEPVVPWREEQSLLLSDLGERGVIEHIRSLLASQTGDHIVLGVGDDCAAFRPAQDELIVVTTDPCPQPVISLLGEKDRWYEGWFSMIINLSDLGAMGAKPIGILLAVEAEESMAVNDLDRFYAGVLEASREFNCPVIGGNVKDAKRFSCIGTAFGTVHPEKILRRNSARPGEKVIVLGEMGLFWAGVIHRLNQITLEPHESETLLESLKRPRPRLREGGAIADKRLSGCAIDSSDGLISCFYEIARAGKQIDVHIDLSEVEPHPLVNKVADVADIDPRKLMLSWGGWELVCTVTESALPVLREVLAEFDCPIATVGWITEGNGKAWFHDKSAMGQLTYIASERFTRRSYFSHGLEAYLDIMRQAPLLHP